MQAIEFKSKIRNQLISIPKEVQVELKNAVEKEVQVMIFLDDVVNSTEFKSTDLIDVEMDELESINRGLKDFEDGRIHSNETVRKLYTKYL